MANHLAMLNTFVLNLLSVSSTYFNNEMMKAIILLGLLNFLALGSASELIGKNIAMYLSR